MGGGGLKQIVIKCLICIPIYQGWRKYFLEQKGGDEGKKFMNPVLRNQSCYKIYITKHHYNFHFISL